jgi:hypothetical protein
MLEDDDETEGVGSVDVESGAIDALAELKSRGGTGGGGAQDGFDRCDPGDSF